MSYSVGQIHKYSVNLYQQLEAEDSFYLVSAAAWQRLDHDYLAKFMPADGSVNYERLTDSIGVFVVAGPLARKLLQRVSADDFSNEAFPFLSARQVEMAGAPVHALRVNYVGELGWELHHPIESQNELFDALFAAGKDLELRPFGIRASGNPVYKSTPYKEFCCLLDSRLRGNDERGSFQFCARFYS